MFRFIHCADIHLDSPMRGLRFADDRAVETVRNATRRALENLVDLAIRERVDFIVISGDIFDGEWEDYATGLFFNRCMQRLSTERIPVYLIKGNHDAASVVTHHLTLPDNVRTFSEREPETVLIEDLQVAVHGQSFAHRDVTENLAAHYPRPVPGYFNIGMLHTGLAGKEGHAPYAPCTMQELLSTGYDYWALGHIHLPEVLNENPYVIYAGNLQGRHIREEGPRGCVLVTVEGQKVNIERVFLDVLRWYTVTCDISEVETESQALATVREQIEEIASENPAVVLCLRIRLIGVRREHQFIHRDRERMTHEVLNAANWAASQTVYVEKITYEEATQGADSIGLMSAESEIAAGLSDVMADMVNEGDMESLVFDTLSTWHRAVATRMQSDDAPAELERDELRAFIRRRAQELNIRMNSGAEGQRGNS